MRCPFCGNVDTQVKDSRPAEDHVAIRRRRFCSACGGRFTTYERVQLRDLVVIKRSGKREDFDRDKLERSIRIALQKRPIEIGVLDGIENKIVLLDSKNLTETKERRRGEKNLQLTTYDHRGISITTFLGEILIQYTKF